jgi:hypothetical protein
MKKKKIARKRVGDSTPIKPVTTPKVDADQPMEEKPFDFGGIPDRNLKKNLGCG